MKTAIASLLASIFCSVSLAGALDELPWAFNAPAADGYSITLESIEPAPGTPLVRGSEVTFTAKVAYKLTIANTGVIALVPQDEKNRAVPTPGKQVRQRVSSPSGSTELKQTLTIPRNAKQLLLFIPLVPDGIQTTTGEVTVRYPVVKK